MPRRDHELEYESARQFEDEFEDYARELEFEGELEDESELEGESELEFESELEGEYEGEYELEGEGELEEEWESEFEGEDEGEEFLRRLRRGLRGAAPLLRALAPIAARAVGSVVGTPVAGMLAGRAVQAATQLLREGELEDELEFEGELEYEDELEYEAHASPPVGMPMTRSRAVAELMATAAGRAASEAEAEAFAGAATVQVLTARDRRELELLLPHLVRGSRVLTRILRRRRITRPAVAVVPQIVADTVGDLRRRQRAGQPVDRRIAARVMAAQTRRVLSDPRTTVSVTMRSARAARRVAPPADVRPRPGLSMQARRDGRELRIGQRVRGRTPSGALVQARVVPVRPLATTRR